MMEQKAKIVIIILAGLLVISVFFAIQLSAAKQKLLSENSTLTSEKKDLDDKLIKAGKDYRRLEEKANSLNQEIDRVAKEKDQLQNQYDLVNKANQELVERLKSVKDKVEAQTVAVAVAPGSNDAYWAGILKNKANLEMQLETLRSELKTAQINAEQLQREKSSLSLEIDNLNLEKQELKRQLEYSQKQLSYSQKSVDSITLELVGEKNDKLQISENLKGLKSEGMLLRRQLKGLNVRKVALERKIQEIQEENKKFDQRFSDMDILLKDKAIQIETLKKSLAVGGVAEQKSGQAEDSSVELPTIVVRPQSETSLQTSSSSTAKVVAVNKDNNFVIIDLGEDSGVKIGDTFRVFKNESVIAHLEVMQVRKAITACDIKKESAPISVGDTVR
jgi:chromosome segregation ATPase